MITTNRAKAIPNILSFTRILLSVYMTFVWEHQIVFLTVFLICGVTDLLDGYLARRWHVTSSLGAFLDSLGDLIFFSALLYWSLCYSNLTISIANWTFIGGIIGIRLINVILTKIKFNRYGIMHTLLNKITGGMFFLLIPLLIFYPSIANRYATLLLGIAFISAIDESVRLIKLKHYEEN